jgi:hypothetical protein
VLSCVLQGSAGPAMVALVQQGLGWVPTACNLAAALAFGLCLSLNAHLTGGSDLSILALAPLLLLLTQVPHAAACSRCTPGAAVLVIDVPPTGVIACSGLNLSTV